MLTVSCSEFRGMQITRTYFMYFYYRAKSSILVYIMRYKVFFSTEPTKIWKIPNQYNSDAHSDSDHVLKTNSFMSAFLST